MTTKTKIDSFTTSGPAPWKTVFGFEIEDTDSGRSYAYMVIQTGATTMRISINQLGLAALGEAATRMSQQISSSNYDEIKWHVRDGVPTRFIPPSSGQS